MRTPWTVNIRPLMYYIGAGIPQSGMPAPDPQGYSVEFFTRGEHVETRGYSFSVEDERLMFARVTRWMTVGPGPLDR